MLLEGVAPLLKVKEVRRTYTYLYSGPIFTRLQNTVATCISSAVRSIIRRKRIHGYELHVIFCVGMFADFPYFWHSRKPCGTKTYFTVFMVFARYALFKNPDGVYRFQSCSMNFRTHLEYAEIAQVWVCEELCKVRLTELFYRTCAMRGTITAKYTGLHRFFGL